jgi:hypothetical protein
MDTINIKIDNKNIDVLANFNLKSNIAEQKSKIELKVQSRDLDQDNPQGKSVYHPRYKE